MYIAIKNSENKGVYRSTEFDYLWLKPGIKSKKFKNSKLNDALKWAGVTEVKGVTDIESSKRRHKKISNNLIDEWADNRLFIFNDEQRTSEVVNLADYVWNIIKDDTEKVLSEETAKNRIEGIQGIELWS